MDELEWGQDQGEAGDYLGQEPDAVTELCDADWVEAEDGVPALHPDPGAWDRRLILASLTAAATVEAERKAQAKAARQAARGHTRAVFGTGRRTPLSPKQKREVIARFHAHNQEHKTARQHWGPLTPATLRVLEAILWQFHNCGSGACFPSYVAIAVAARCSPRTVASAIKALKAAGLITWDNRLVRVRKEIEGQLVIVPQRTSNAYRVPAWNYTTPEISKGWPSAKIALEPSEETSESLSVSPPAVGSALERRLSSLRAAIAESGPTI